MCLIFDLKMLGSQHVRKLTGMELRIFYIKLLSCNSSAYFIFSFFTLFIQNYCIFVIFRFTIVLTYHLVN